jgi:hypothetical protein
MFHKNTSRFVYGRKSLPAICASALREHISPRGPGDGPGPLTQSLSIDKQGGERG